jgi:hypothetical protein
VVRWGEVMYSSLAQLSAYGVRLLALATNTKIKQEVESKSSYPS